MSLSIAITGFVNFITFLASIPLIGVGIWLATKLNTECVKFLEWPVIVIGLIILVISLAGCIGSCYRIPWLLWFYLFIMFLVILLLLAFIIFAYVVTKDGPGTEDGRRDYRLQDYSPWLQNELKDASNWQKVKSCIISSKVCNNLNAEYTTYTSFQNAKISPVQAGCCTPPVVCGYQYGLPTYWTNPTNQNAETDCYRWNNVQTLLCYYCDTCRAGVAAQIKQGWRKAAVLSVIVIAVLIVVEFVGCCAFRNAQIHDVFKHETGRYWRRYWRRHWLRHWFRTW